jgi:hypothetical protein
MTTWYIAYNEQHLLNFCLMSAFVREIFVFLGVIKTQDHYGYNKTKNH